jgi:hypothetical protein
MKKIRTVIPVETEEVGSYATAGVLSEHGVPMLLNHSLFLPASF